MITEKIKQDLFTLPVNNKSISMVVTFYGISNYTATEYPLEGDIIKKVASENQYIIEKVDSGRDQYKDSSFSYKIYNKKLESKPIKRNGWTLGDFYTNHSWDQTTIYYIIKDNTNKSIHDYNEIVKSSSSSRLSHTFMKGHGLMAINFILGKFLEISESENWNDYLGKKLDIILDEQYRQSLEEEIKDDNIFSYEKEDANKKAEILSLKKELENFKLENEALKVNLKQLEQIFTKANRIFQKQYKKPSKKS